MGPGLYSPPSEGRGDSTDHATGRMVQAVPDRLKGIISTALPSLTGSRGEYLREISLVCSPFQNYADIIDQTPFEARTYNLGGQSEAVCTISPAA